ncbi:MAG: long-chain fatty acid--CoA ligase [Polyangiaceae bacterium]
MDVTPYLKVENAGLILLEAAARHGDLPRFMLPTSELPRGNNHSGFAPLSWLEHARQVAAVWRLLSDFGLQGGERAAVFGHNRVEWMAAALGTQAAGGVCVPIYPASTGPQAAYIVNHSDARVVFVDSVELLGRLLDHAGQLTAVERVQLIDPDLSLTVVGDLLASRLEHASARALLERTAPWSELVSAMGEAEVELATKSAASVPVGAPGMMLYTSGTTGHPKGVPLTHENLGINWRDWFVSNAPRLPEDGVDLLWLPMSHIFGYGETIIGNRLGFLSYLTDPKTVLDLMPRIRPSVFMSVPVYWERLASAVIDLPDEASRAKRLQEVTGGRLQFCLSGGAGLKRQVKEQFLSAGILIIEGYGLTECSPTLTLNRPDDFDFESVGKPLPSVELKLDEDGEILAKGPSIFRGYHKNPEATAEAFNSQGWFKTGDLGRFTDRGFLQIIGRKKEILVTAGGKNVAPGNIEKLFADDPLIEHAVAYGDAKKYIVLGVWPNRAELEERSKSSGRTAEELIQSRIDAANHDLARFEQIKRFKLMHPSLSVDDGMLTTTLKLRRKAVYERFRAAFEGLYD